MLFLRMLWRWDVTWGITVKNGSRDVISVDPESLQEALWGITWVLLPGQVGWSPVNGFGQTGASSSTSCRPPPWHYYQGRLQSFPPNPHQRIITIFTPTLIAAQYISTRLPLQSWWWNSSNLYKARPPIIEDQKLTWIRLDLFCGINLLLRISLHQR